MKKALSFLICVLTLFNTVLIASAVDNVDVDLKWAEDLNGEWKEISDAQPFSAEGFEPGSEIIRYFKLSNIGSLAFSYELSFICEGVLGELAEVIDVYTKSEVTENVSVSDMENIGTLSSVVNGDALFTGDRFYNDEVCVAVALKMKDDAESKYMGADLGDGFKISLSATQCDYDYPSVDKFDIKFPNTDGYLYRVGNMNTVALGSLFEALDGVEIGNVSIDIEGSNASGTYTANSSDWTKGTIQFSGTGPVKVTISDDSISAPATPVSLNLEVIDAKNATAATSATANNVVLLNDVGLSTLTVSNGYTLFGNGFKMTAANDIRNYAMDVGFVTLNNGTLDNVQIICPNFSHSIIYNSNKTDEGNQNTYDENSETYGNIRSAVMVDGESTISNSYIHGGRAAVFARSGNILVDNSTISGGAAANIHTISAKSLTLCDVTLIQKPFLATVYDTTKTIMGLSGLFECDESGASTPLYLEGTLRQDAWIDESHEQYIPSGLSDAVDTVLSKTDYLHDLDGDGTNESANLGFTYIPQTVGGATASSVVDNRTDKENVPYKEEDVSKNLVKALVYSYMNTNGTSPDFILGDDYSYTPTEQGATAPAVSFTDTNDDRAFTTKFDADSGYWTSTLTVNLDNGSYDFNFSDLVAVKNEKELNYSVEEYGTQISKSDSVSLTEAVTKEYVLTIEDDEIYGADGEKLGTTAYHTYNFVIVATKTSIPEPEVEDSTGGTPLMVVKAKDGDWSCAIPALEGIKIKYYTKENVETSLDLATLTPTTTGKQNGTESYWETTKDGYTLKVTCSAIHETKGVYGMPVVVDNDGYKMYFTISSTNGYVSTETSSRTVTLTYEFTDPNSKILEFSKTWQFNYADYSEKQYSYSDFVNGTLTEAGSGCLTEGTLITLADGSEKAVEDLTFEDEILAWDFFNGEYTVTTPSLLIDDGKSEYEVITLSFDDGNELKIIDIHGLYDADLDEYVYIDPENVSEYVGHSFIKNIGMDNEAVKLIAYEVSKEYTGCYTILTAFHNNCIANGMLTVTPPPIDGWYDYFEIGEDMKYDAVVMEQDIEKYGLYTYDDFSDYISYEEYLAFNGAYLKILVEKGYFTFEDILEQIAIFGVGAETESEETEVITEEETYEAAYEEPFVYTVATVSEEPVYALSEATATAEVTVTSDLNTITAAAYSVSVEPTNATETDGAYVCQTDEAVFKLTASGAKTGYAIITVDGDTYYTGSIADGQSVSVTVKNAKGKSVAISSGWGVAPGAAIEDSLIDLGEIFVESTDLTDSGAKAVISNTTKYDSQSANIYIAVYNTDTNTLAALNGVTAVIEAKDGCTISVDAEIPSNYEIKVFVWDDALTSLIK